MRLKPVVTPKPLLAEENRGIFASMCFLNASISADGARDTRAREVSQVADVVDDRRATRTGTVVARLEHVVVDDELAAVDQVEQARLAA